MELFNDMHEKVCNLSGIKEICITSTLKTGDKELSFQYRKDNTYAKNIKEEAYITSSSSNRLSRPATGINAPE